MADDNHWDFIHKIMRYFIVVNPLHSEEFLPVTTMEAEIIRMVLDMYHGDENTCGIGTSGGTESILLAMLAYREKAKLERGVTQPNIVLSETAHAAFSKAGHYFKMEIRKVPVLKNLRANVKGMEN
jgi:sphinganine-1-phosphate aldolase